MFEAVEARQVGFHFEEGGCWGMARALHDQFSLAGVIAEVRYSDSGFVHAWVHAAGRNFDYRGEMLTAPGAYKTVPADGLLAIASSFGVEAEEFGSDVELARQVVNDAWSAADLPGQRVLLDSKTPFIGYLGKRGQFESYSHSAARAADYHHSFLIRDVAAYDEEGALTFVRFDGKPVFSIKGSAAMEPHAPASITMIAELARRLVAAGADPQMPIEIEDMGFPKAQAPYQGKRIGTLLEWTLRDAPKEPISGRRVALVPVDHKDWGQVFKVMVLNGYRAGQCLEHSGTTNPVEWGSEAEAKAWLVSTGYMVVPLSLSNHDRWSIYQERSAQIGDAMIRWVECSDACHVIDIQAGNEIRGRQLIQWLSTSRQREIHAVGVVEEAAGFWDAMEAEDLVKSQTDEDFMTYFGRGVAMRPAP
jgi:hypothetical protein